MKKNEILKEIVRLWKISETESLNQFLKPRLNWLIRNYLENPFDPAGPPDLKRSHKNRSEVQKLVNREYELIHTEPKNDKNRQELEKIKLDLEKFVNQSKTEKEKLTEIYWSNPSALPLSAIADPEELEKVSRRRMLSKAEGRLEELLHLVDDNGAWVFRDQYNTPHVHLPPGTNVPIDSPFFEGWVRRIDGEKNLSDEQLKNLKGILKGRAFSPDCQIFPLHTRVAETWETENHGELTFVAEVSGWKERVWYYDLGNGRAERITSEGPEICENPPILFRRFSHQKPQVEPEFRPEIDLDQDLLELLNFINLPEIKTNSGISDQEALILVWFVAAFIPGFPHPILAIHGPQGSAKSTMLRVIKELLDPSAIQTLSLTTPDDLVIQANSHWFIPLDNLSHITGEMSDALSRTCTGDGISRRKLYTDSDEIVLSFQRVIGLNGITLVTAAADLLDRSILLILDRVRGDRRQTEKDLWRKFEEIKPYILGSVFNVLSEVLEILKDWDWKEKQGWKNDDLPKDLSRMADFHKFGSVIAKVIGVSKEFERGYRAAIRQQNDEAIDANQVAQVVILFMKDKTFWQGSPTECLNDLKNEAEKLGIDTKSKYWPKDSSALSRRLEKAKTNLEAIGIRMERSKKGERLITLTKIPLKSGEEPNKEA